MQPEFFLAVVENVPPGRVWEALRSDPKTQLVDGRTDPEWNSVSLPDLASACKQMVLIPWQAYRSMQQNAAFTDQLKEAGSMPDQHLYFHQPQRPALSRRDTDGASRWLSARLHRGGRIEGAPNADDHRGAVPAWKVKGLHWRQR